MKIKEVCPFRRAFFSLNSNYVKGVYENMMIFIWKAGWTYRDIYNMPIGKRNWLFDTFAEINEKAMTPPEEE
jgi:hypothetical protein